MSNPATAESVAREIVDQFDHDGPVEGLRDLERNIAAAIRSHDAACAQRVAQAYEKAAEIAENENEFGIASWIRNLINTESTNSAALRKDGNPSPKDSG